MKAGNRIGIWMDHSNAHVIEFSPEMKTRHIQSKFTKEEKEKTLAKSEQMMHNKEQGQQLEFYKQLEEIIQHCDEVLLFGPTDAKRELHNHLSEDHRFANIKIEVKSADKMSEHDEKEFVRKYFAKHL
jgi:acetyl-CoA carboxylase beta subunit